MFDHQDQAEALEELGRLRKENGSLRAAVVRERGAALAATYCGDPAYAPAFAARLTVDIEGDQVRVFTTDTEGRRVTRFDTASSSFRPLHDDEIAAELKSRFPRLPWRDRADIAIKQDAKDNESDELMRMMRIEGAKLTAERAAENSEFLRDVRERERNPFRAGASFNLTDQMRVARLDPALAGELKRQAEAT
ncbi:MAG TPA: hypothetical protein VGV41_12475 [Pseudolabrys sp.]|uniref:hypothetical protein n=1 Tax=Pseudolabrys sp. TaxID=1960880 RepID=UPI002DDD6CE6|nr:hypothetical protein [Pseudolabrys sp.]HEV2629446.1 hypothetical protein [Pseudolabrys sp.]